MELNRQRDQQRAEREQRERDKEREQEEEWRHSQLLAEQEASRRALEALEVRRKEEQEQAWLRAGLREFDSEFRREWLASNRFIEVWDSLQGETSSLSGSPPAGPLGELLTKRNPIETEIADLKVQETDLCDRLRGTRQAIANQETKREAIISTCQTKILAVNWSEGYAKHVSSPKDVQAQVRQIKALARKLRTQCDLVSVSTPGALEGAIGKVKATNLACADSSFRGFGEVSYWLVEHAIALGAILFLLWILITFLALIMPGDWAMKGLFAVLEALLAAVSKPGLMFLGLLEKNFWVAIGLILGIFACVVLLANIKPILEKVIWIPRRQRIKEEFLARAQGLMDEAEGLNKDIAAKPEKYDASGIRDVTAAIARHRANGSELNRAIGIVHERIAVLESRKKPIDQCLEKHVADLRTRHEYMKGEIRRVGREILQGWRVPGVKVKLSRCLACAGPVSSEASRCPYCDSSMT
jgi:hypothetical protein